MKYNSNRVRKFGRLGITSDRYEFLGLEQAEPDLGDPKVGVSSIGVNPVPSGDQYVLISVEGHEGKRYWVKSTDQAGAGIQGTQGLQGSLSNFQGTQGLQGRQGSQGVQGTQGLQGLQGPPGNFQGTQGTQGNQGSQGTQGRQGTQGLQGRQGSQGSQGVQGTQGLQGIQSSLSNFQGTQGAQGAQGTQGRQGVQGTQGRQGVQGMQGVQGLQGDQGIQGLQGDQGVQGVQGLQGDQGIQGLQGDQGVQGVQGLQGDQGIQGTQGLQGVQSSLSNFQGTQGTQGLQGLQGLQGPPGNFQGTQGTQGVQGLQGTQGVQGLQGVQGGGGQGLQGVQGNGWQGTQGVQGTQGRQGVQGLQGLQGAGFQGLQGNQGATGFTGASIQGSQGTQGAQGTQGRQGVQGSGFQGLQGTQGNQGMQGVQGLQGLQGNTGASGNSVQGSQGSQGVSGRTSTTPYTVMSFESGGDLNAVNTILTTIGGYAGTINLSKMATTDNLPAGSPICVFSGGGNGTRYIQTSRRIWLTTVSTLYFYLNKAGDPPDPNDPGWGDAPEVGEALELQYSKNGTSWTTFTGQNIDPDDIAGSNNWILRTVTVPEDAKSYGGVFIRFIQSTNSGGDSDGWAISPLLIATGGSSGGGGGSSGSSVVLLDTSNEFSVVLDKVLLTKRDDFNPNIPVREPIVTGKTPIAIFGPDANSGGGDRSIATIKKVYLATVDTIEFYTSEGGNWGEEPDLLVEALSLQYSKDGTSWVGIHTMDPGANDYSTWIQNVVKLPEEAKTYDGVYLRLYQGNTTVGDNWATTSIIVKSFNSNNNTSYAIFDFSSNQASTSHKGTRVYTISSYNDLFNKSMASSSDVPVSSSICVFDNYDLDIDDRRTCEINSKIYFSNINKLIFNVNKGGNGWGESPDGGENLVLQYSFDKTTWTTFHTIDRSSGTNTTNTTYISSSNVWTKVSVGVPNEIKNFSGVYLRFLQLDVDNDDTWAISTVIGELISNPGTIVVNDNSSSSVTRYVGLVTVTTGFTTETYVSSSKLTFNQSTGTLSSTAFASLSDITKKINIQEIKDPIGITQQLIGVRFDWKDTNKPSIGLIAQEVEKVIPEVIETDINGFKTVNYDALIPILIESIKDHEKRIVNLESL
jgi:hypothetical protein